MNVKGCLPRLLSLGLLGATAAFADTDLTGDWRGKLVIDATTSVPVQFVFAKQPDGSYSAVLNSLENEFIKKVAASTVSWQNGALKIDVPALSGAYSGMLKDDHFEGQWSQQGKAIPLALNRPPQASQADLDVLTGSWQGTMPGSAKLKVLFEFKQDGKGRVTGSLAVPEQGVLGMPFANLEVGPGTLAFKIPSIGAEYRGAFSGTGMTGTLKQRGETPDGRPLNLTRSDVATSP